MTDKPAHTPWRVIPTYKDYQPLYIENANGEPICGWPLSKEHAALIVAAVNGQEQLQKENAELMNINRLMSDELKYSIETVEIVGNQRAADKKLIAELANIIKHLQENYSRGRTPDDDWTDKTQEMVDVVLSKIKEGA